MRIKTWVEFSEEVETTIDAADFLGSLAENLHEQRDTIGQGLNICAEFLKAITDAQITTLSPQAIREGQAPLRISEEWYADVAEECVVYFTGPGSLHLFWRVYDRLKAGQAVEECGDGR